MHPFWKEAVRKENVAREGWHNTYYDTARLSQTYHQCSYNKNGARTSNRALQSTWHPSQFQNSNNPLHNTARPHTYRRSRPRTGPLPRMDAQRAALSMTAPAPGGQGRSTPKKPQTARLPSRPAPSPVRPPAVPRPLTSRVPTVVPVRKTAVPAPPPPKPAPPPSLPPQQNKTDDNLSFGAAFRPQRVSGAAPLDQSDFFQTQTKEYNDLGYFRQTGRRLYAKGNNSHSTRGNKLATTQIKLQWEEYKEIDTDGDGQIGRKEFLALITKSLDKNPKAFPGGPPSFEAFDEDNSGFITFEEYSKRMAAIAAEGQE